MALLTHSIDFVLHVDKYLDQIFAAYGTWTLGLLFGVIFCETGLVVTPFLPGDSLLFAVGAFAARGSWRVATAILLLAAAAIIGDNVNYWVGRYVGPRVFRREDVPFLNRKHLERTHRFYERYGGKTIVLARFVPIVRTFSPFVAGVGAMRYARFVIIDICGGFLWVSLFVLAGFYFGNLMVVRQNFSLVILAIIALSVSPALVEYLRHRKEQVAVSRESPSEGGSHVTRPRCSRLS
jgi:membrane-associated protein